MAEKYDVIIIGSGPAGLTAAVYTTRANFKTLIIAGAKWGGQLQLTTIVENFPGFADGIQGPDLMTAMRKQAERFGTVFIDDNLPPTDFSKFPNRGPFTFKIGEKEVEGKAVLIATGADTKWLGVKGEQERIGKGVSTCAPCDAFFFRNKQVVVVGGGDSAMEEACVLTSFASHVTIIHRRDAFKASKIMLEKARKNPKISFIMDTVLTEILGNNKVEKVKLKNLKTNEESEMPIDGVFVAIGHTPNTTVFQGIDLTERGYIKRHEQTKTNIDGVFVSGDVEDDRYMQAITAAGFGCMAALDLEKWLREKN